MDVTFYETIPFFSSPNSSQGKHYFVESSPPLSVLAFIFDSSAHGEGRRFFKFILEIRNQALQLFLSFSAKMSLRLKFLI